MDVHIRNVRLEEVFASSVARSNAGALIGELRHAAVSRSSVENLYISASFNVGGLVGEAGDSRVESSFVKGGYWVDGYNSIGGLVGALAGNVTIADSFTEIPVWALAGNGGGLVGSLSPSDIMIPAAAPEIGSSTATPQVLSKETCRASRPGIYGLGGLVGRIVNDAAGGPGDCSVVLGYGNYRPHPVRRRRKRSCDRRHARSGDLRSLRLRYMVLVQGDYCRSCAISEATPWRN